MTIAALPMYDLPELQPANDALWTTIASRLADAGIDAPAELDRTTDLNRIWNDPALLLAQTCGYPLMTSLHGRVALLTTPCYAAPGCEGARYRSAIIVRATDRATVLADLRGRRCAVNDTASNSGMNLLRAAIAPLPRTGDRFFSEITITGSHAASMQAVAQGDADTAAIDCVTWAQLQTFRPAQTRHLRVLDWTAATPGLPLITSIATRIEARRVLIQALADVACDSTLEAARLASRLERFTVLPLADYDLILTLERHAIVAGYPILR